MLLASCGGSDGLSALAMKITDQGCDSATLSAPEAGLVTFALENAASKRGEFEIVSATPSIIFEGYLTPGESKEVKVQLRAGSYELICGNTNTPSRGRLSVGPGATEVAAAQGSDRAALDAIAADYTTVVRAEATKLERGTRQFTNAVRAGDTARAKALYATVREPWERIEPVAEAFPDADAAIDSRADDHPRAEADPGFTGFHALEYGLWAQGTKKGARVNMNRLATRLDADVATLVRELRGLNVTPEAMTNGAAALIEEAAQTKVTGEEERYSRTDLATLASNLEGSRTVFKLIEDRLGRADPQLRDDTLRAMRRVQAVITPYQSSAGFASYAKVSREDRNRLKTTMAELSELLARVPGSLGLELAG